MGNEARRGGGRQGNRRRHAELRQFPAGYLRLPHHRFFYLYVYQAAYQADGEAESGSAGSSARTSGAEQGGTVADGDSRYSEREEIGGNQCGGYVDARLSPEDTPCLPGIFLPVCYEELGGIGSGT